MNNSVKADATSAGTSTPNSCKIQIVSTDKAPLYVPAATFGVGFQALRCFGVSRSNFFHLEPSRDPHAQISVLGSCRPR